MNKPTTSFSKLTKSEKIELIANKYFTNPEEAKDILRNSWMKDEKTQALFDDFIENSIANFCLPLGVAPNYIINGRNYTIPMATEESSVVAAASKSAKYWAERGGFRTSVFGVEKVGQVHFVFKGNQEKLVEFFEMKKALFFEHTYSITKNMQDRGGGILDIVLKDKTALMPNYYQLHATFNTKNSMGANFINSCLEQFSITLKEEAWCYDKFNAEEKDLRVIMSILSNYVPNCVVHAEVSCPVSGLVDKDIQNPQLFAENFVQAVRIAEVEKYRAVTHNKGIMNGIDSVVIATGNDFRAVEAGVHAFASSTGEYSSLSHARVENNVFSFWLDIPLSLGTVGGLTNLHPMARFSMEMLGNPNADDLMKIVAVSGLSQNFAAIRSLITTGIQHGHMKMHLNNILTHFNASDTERRNAMEHFATNTVLHSAVEEFLRGLR